MSGEAAGHLGGASGAGPGAEGPGTSAGAGAGAGPSAALAFECSSQTSCTGPEGLHSTLGAGPLATVEGCAAALADGSVTAEQLVRRGLERIAALDGPDGLNAVVTIAPDALDEARASDERRARGNARGPLDGVPFTVKDCIETAGLRTTHGSALFADWVPARDATVVERLRAAGLVLLAKVNLDDFAGACFGESSLVGAMRNPYDRDRTVGGSSGGSAVAVAAGYAPVSIGTDTGGSLRIPAALTGVATLRPSVGLVSRAGIFPRSGSQDTAGPMATTVRGLAMTLDALVGSASRYDPRDRATARAVGARPRPGYAASTSSTCDPAGLSVGIVEGGLAIWGDDPHGPVLERFRAVVAALERAGVRTVAVPAPPRDLLDSSSVISFESRAAVDEYLRTAEPAAPVGSFDELLASGSFTRHSRVAFEREAVVDGGGLEALRAYRRREELAEATLVMLAEHSLDAVLYPSLQRVAAPLGVEQAGAFTRWSESTGFPAVAVPMGLVAPAAGDALLPCAAELLGRPFAERELLDLATVLEAAARTVR